jgi:hypothetical protein
MASFGDGPRLSPRATDRLEAALEASLEALMELQLVRASGPDAESSRPHIGGAIDLLRAVITELRVAGVEHPNPLARGFVLGRRATRPLDSDEPADQSRP